MDTFGSFFLIITYLILSHALIKTQNISLKTTFHMPERNVFFNIYLLQFFLIFNVIVHTHKREKSILVENYHLSRIFAQVSIKVDFHETNLFLAFWLVRKIDFAAKYFASQESRNDFYLFAAIYFASANYLPRGQTEIFYIFQRHCLWH